MLSSEMPYEELYAVHAKLRAMAARGPNLCAKDKETDIKVCYITVCFCIGAALFR